MGYTKYYTIRPRVGKYAGQKIERATREPNFNTRRPSYIFVTDREDEYMYNEEDVEVLDS